MLIKIRPREITFHYLTGKHFCLFLSQTSWVIGLEVSFARNLHLFRSVVALYSLMREVQDLILGSIHEFCRHSGAKYRTLPIELREGFFVRWGTDGNAVG